MSNESLNSVTLGEKNGNQDFIFKNLIISWTEKLLPNMFWLFCNVGYLKKSFF